MTLDAQKKGLQTLFNVQRLLTNVEKIIKLQLQRFFTYLFTYHVKIITCYLNKHTPKILSHIFYPKIIPMEYIETKFLRLVATLYSMSSVQ